ncbi:hypothetical protein AAF712_005686 [Marasmius tenuissimus]|uniref:Uncharacterized protein n=1 Tax=Marasmius tenuissimus TaxID=585030 RepID=A0ABR3A0Y0_9AGAR
MPKISKETTSGRVSSTPYTVPLPGGGSVIGRRKANDKNIGQRLKALRDEEGLPDIPTIPGEQGMFIGSSEHIDDSAHPKFRFLGCRYYLVSDRSHFDLKTLIPLDRLVNDETLRVLLLRRDVLKPIPNNNPSTSKRSSRPTTKGKSVLPREPSVRTTAAKVDVVTNRASRAPTSGVIEITSDEDDDKGGKYISTQIAGRSIFGEVIDITSSESSENEDNTGVLNSDDTLIGVQEDNGKEKLTLSSRYEAKDGVIDFQVALFVWTRNNTDPKHVNIPVLKTENSFITLEGIKFELGTIGLEVGDNVERYVPETKVWSTIKWFTPFRVCRENAIGLKLMGVRDIIDWDQYSTHTFV